MKLNIKNYSTTINYEKSIGEIQSILMKFGATRIMLDVDSGIIEGLTFGLTIEGSVVPFRLPSNTKQVVEMLYKAHCSATRRPRKGRNDFEKQARDIAWRLLRDWIHAQLSIIQIGLVKVEQVFLPYAFDGKNILADRILSGDKKELLSHVDKG